MEIRTNQIQIVDINSIKLNPDNFNTHPKEQIAQLAKIIEYNGFRRPLTVSTRTGFLNCGEGRYLAAKKLGMKEIPVMFQDYEDQEHEIADAVADNQIDKQSVFDFQKLNAKLPEIGPIDLDVLGLKDFKVDPLELKHELEVSDEIAKEEWIITVFCHNENEMQDLYNEFRDKGLECKLMK